MKTGTMLWWSQGDYNSTKIGWSEMVFPDQNLLVWDTWNPGAVGRKVPLTSEKDWDYTGRLNPEEWK